MKWFMLIGVSMLCAGCGCYNTEMVTYAPVSTCKSVVTCKPVATCKPLVNCRRVMVSPVIEPVMYSYSEPLDVTTAVVDFY